MPSWDHQPRTLAAIEQMRASGVRRLCVQGPTGSGKTRTFMQLVRQEVERGGRAVIYTDRRTIRNQISEVFDRHGLGHGIRAAGYDARLREQVQVSSIMTERARALAEEPVWDLHRATLVVIDEAHRARGKVSRALMRHHLQQGAFLTGWTATPVGIGHLYDEIIQMATLEELRQAGVLVWCDVYAPEEMDLRGVRLVSGEFHQGQSRERVKEFWAVGSVIDHYLKLNPDHHPAVLFAPGVAESRWMANEFTWNFIRSEHIDARTSDEKRREVFEKWRGGEIELVCNFGVLREGFDFQECRHAILVQPTNKISTYLQIVGRILRAAAGKDHAILQDHTGAYWRHGSPNQDRTWQLQDSDSKIAQERKQEPGEIGPRVCPNCGVVRYNIPGWQGACPICGYQSKPVTHIIRETNGKLVQVEAGTKTQPQDSRKAWTSCIYSAVRNKRRPMTAGQAVVMFKQKTGQWAFELQGAEPAPTPSDAAWNRPAVEMWPWAAPKRKETA